MRRRPLIAALGTSIGGAVAGCLGSGQDGDTPSDDGTPPGDDPDDDNQSGDGNGGVDMHEPVGEWFQPDFDAGNSRYARGITGPLEEPARQRVYEEIDNAPILVNDTFYFTVTPEDYVDNRLRAVGLDGELQWDAPAEVLGIPSQPALHDDTVVVAGNKIPRCHAVSRHDGEAQWQTYLSNGPWSGTVSLVENRLFFATPDGVGCVDLDAEDEVWDVNVEAEIAAEHALFGDVAATPSHVCIVNRTKGSNRDFAENPRRMYALNPETGGIEWSVDLEIRQAARALLRPVIGDGRLFVIGAVDDHPEGEADHDAWVQVAAVDLDHQEVAWTRTLEGGFDTPGIVPAVGNGRLYVNHGIIEEGDTPLFSAIDTADGEVLWTVESTSTILHPVVTDDLIYAVGSSLRAFDPATGDERWSIELFEPDPSNPASFFRVRNPPLVYDGRLYVYLRSEGYIAFE